jgi:hypothetical protein
MNYLFLWVFMWFSAAFLLNFFQFQAKSKDMPDVWSWITGFAGLISLATGGIGLIFFLIFECGSRSEDFKNIDNGEALLLDLSTVPALTETPHNIGLKIR